MSHPASWLRRLRRRLDRRFYRGLFRLYRTVFPTPPGSGRIPAKSIRRVLIVRHDRVGDMILSTPLLSLIKDVAPHAEIDVLASPQNASLVSADDRVARVFVNARSWRGWLGLLPRLRRRRYDVVFSLVGRNALREGVVASLVAHRRTYKVSAWRPTRYHGLFTTVVRLPRGVAHGVDQVLYVGWAALGRGSFDAGALAQRYPLRLAIGDDAERAVSAFLSARGIGQFVLVNLAAAEPWRQWQPARCAQFVQLLLRRYPGLWVVLDSPPGKEDLVAEVVRRCGSTRVVVAPSTPRVLELAALVSRASLVVTPNTAVVHIASACKRPVVGLYTTRDGGPGLWLPFGVPYRALTADPGEGVSEIPVQSIVRAFEELWAQISTPEHAAQGGA